jgi:hypothetical protein
VAVAQVLRSTAAVWGSIDLHRGIRDLSDAGTRLGMGAGRDQLPSGLQQKSPLLPRYLPNEVEFNDVLKKNHSVGLQRRTKAPIQVRPFDNDRSVCLDRQTCDQGFRGTVLSV